MFLSKYIVFHVQKIKVNNSVVGCYAVKLIFYFSFFIFSPFQWLCYISCYVKNFLGGSHLFGDSVSIFKENTWKSYYRQLQVIIMSFNKKKKLLWIFLASPTQRTHNETCWVLHRELLLMNVSKQCVDLF